MSPCHGARRLVRSASSNGAGSLDSRAGRKKRLPIHDAPTALPSPLAGWADAILHAPLPAEPIATCDACVMVPPSGEAMGDEHFNPATKCCAYIPTLHNYLVGGVLAERDPAMAVGRERVLARIDERVGVTPLGVAAPSHFGVLYGPDRFGRSETLRCPYYLEERGQCGVWKHRNTVCSTWFCKHGRGASSRRLWKALEAALSEAERATVRFAVLEIDVGPEALAALFPHPGDVQASANAGDLDKRVDLARYARVWGNWLGRERAFYARAAEIATTLTWDDTLRLGGSELAARVRVAQDAFESFTSGALPPRLRVGRFEIVSMDDTTTRLATYTPFDPIDLPNALVTVLHRFDGRATRQVLAGIRENDGLELASSLVRKLVDFEVLVPV